MNQLFYKKDLPTKVGWYWKRDLSDRNGGGASVVHVRNYGGSLAIDNCLLEGCGFYSRCEWAGPIPEPTEPTEPTAEG